MVYSVLATADIWNEILYLDRKSQELSFYLCNSVAGIAILKSSSFVRGVVVVLYRILTIDLYRILRRR